MERWWEGEMVKQKEKAGERERERERDRERDVCASVAILAQAIWP